MRKLFSIAVMIIASISTMAQQPDSSAIKTVTLEYIDGWYAGDVVRMEKAIHPDINKAMPRDLPQTDKTTIVYNTFSALIEFTRANAGALDDSARHIQIQILNIDSDVADAKITSANFIEYVQLVKLEGQWKIINVLFTIGASAPPRIQNFNPDNERNAIEQTALNYLAGITGADSKRLEITISPEFNKISLNPLAVTGKTSIRRQRYESIIENTFARIGKLDEIYRDNRVEILDITNGLAVVRCDMATTYEFVQMFKSGEQWKILNCISKQNTGLTLEKALSVTVGNPMPDFTLPIYGGKEFKLSEYRGKNVMLVFPRGWLGMGWCPYCPYQYLELEQLEKTTGIRSKYDLEIAFVMPYSSERIKDWIEKFPIAVKTVEGIKNPNPAPQAGTINNDFSAWARKNFPIKFDVKADDSHNVIPLLVDEKRTLSRQMKIFTNFWDGVAAEQNMATVLIIDKNGILQFKYVSQMTEDRPTVEFLLDFIKKMK